MPLQGRYRVIANKMPNGTRNVIGHLTTDLRPVRATRKKFSEGVVDKLRKAILPKILPPSPQ